MRPEVERLLRRMRSFSRHGRLARTEAQSWALLRSFNRSLEKVEALTPSTTPEEAGALADEVLSMLAVAADQLTMWRDREAEEMLN